VRIQLIKKNNEFKKYHFFFIRALAYNSYNFFPNLLIEKKKHFFFAFILNFLRFSKLVFFASNKNSKSKRAQQRK
jgi:hypothetical protein